MYVGGKDRLLAIGVLVLASSLSGCVMNRQTGRPEMAPGLRNTFHSVFNSPDPCSNKDRNIGMLVGTLVGAAAGYKAHGKKGALVGALVGMGGGGLIGHVLDNRRCNLYKIARANRLKLASAAITEQKLGMENGSKTKSHDTIGLDVQLQNQGDEFVPGTAELTPKAKRYFAQIASQYTPQALPAKAGRETIAQRKVLVVAHSDEIADQGQAAKLTQRRARAVAEVFRKAGVPSHNIYYQGAGDTLPIASNDTTVGRAQNQRVQIVDVPDERTLKRYLQRRQPDANYFEAAHASTLAQASVAAPKQEATVGSATPGHEHPAAEAPLPHRHSDYGRAYAGYDFGGAPLPQVAVTSIDLGAPVVHSTFSLISEAHADTPLRVGSCVDDHPHTATPVRNLSSGKDLPVRDYMPGFFGAPWLGGFHGNLVVVDKAYVPRDSGSPVPRPKLMIYRRYRGNADAKPNYSARVPVNVYRGEKATLFRMFVGGPMKCIDFVKINHPGQAEARLYYTRRTELYLAKGAFALRH